MTDSSISGNFNAFDGGGIYNNFVATMTLTDSTVSGNTVSHAGGGIYNGNNLTASGCYISGNSSGYTGGGILTKGTLILSDSTVSGNSAVFGGGLENFTYGGSASMATISNCTFTGNSAAGSGSGINNWQGNTITLSDSTISYNVGGNAGVFNSGTTITMDNCIVTDNSYDLGGYITGNYNVIGTGAIIGSSDITGVAPGTTVTSTLALNGGTTPSLALLPGSPAFGVGDPSQVGTTSQNGVVRPATPDIGAYQTPSAPTVNQNLASLPDTSTTITITGTNFDATTPGNNLVTFNLGVVGTVTASTTTQLTVTLSVPPTALGALTAVITTGGVSSGAAVQVGTEVNGIWDVTDTSATGTPPGSAGLTDVTLPYAVASALSGDTIIFAASTNGTPIVLQSTLAVANDITITGNGAANTIISGGGTVEDFNVTASGSGASISGVTIENGVNGITNSGTLDVSDSVISGNSGSSSNPGSSGGGIFNTGDLTLSNATITGNTAVNGAGLGNYGAGSATISNSTIAGNTNTAGSGSGINNSAAGTIILTDSTIAYNIGGVAGIDNAGGTFTMDNNIVTGSVNANSNADIVGPITGSFNLTGAAVTGLAATLANNGGTTPTLALSASSSAIGIGDPAQAGSISQNGLTRPAAPDIGAFQTVAPITISSININAGTDPIISASNPSAGVFSFTTDGANTFTVGDPVLVIGVGAPYDGTYTVASVGVNSFTVSTSPSNSGVATVIRSGTATDSAQTGGLLINGASSATSQRSMVDSIVYKFSQPVSLAQSGVADGNAFSITGTGSVPGTPPTWIYNSPDGGTTWIVTFVGATGGSIANGEYQIVLNNTAVSPVSGSAALASSDTESFYRLYGDTVGNGHYRVNASDNIAFLSTFNQLSTAAAFLAYLDINQHGSINATDNINFLADFSTHYTGFTATI